MTMCQVAYLAGIVWCEWNTATDILGIFEANQTCDGVMHIFGSNRGKDIIQGKRSIGLILDRAGLNPPQGGHPTRFIQINMRQIPNNYFISALTMDQQRDQIS